MQRVEASWVLGVAVELARRGAFVTPIHDALLIDAAQVDEVREALAGAAFERWGARPSFGVERLEVEKKQPKGGVYEVPSGRV